MKTNWPVKKLGEVADILGGYAFKSSELKEEKVNDDYLPVIKIGSLLTTGVLENIDLQFHKFEPELSKYLIKEKDILIAMTGATVGKVAISNNKNLLLNQRVGLVRSKETLSQQDFLKYLLLANSFYKYCQSTSGGGAQGNISPSQIMNYAIPLPSIQTQKKIVERLDAIRKAQELCDQQIQKTEELFESILHSEVKSTGKEVFLTEATDFQEGPGILAKDFRNSGIPLVRLKGTAGPEVTLKGCNFLDPLMVKQKWNHFILKIGDLLLTTSASLGQVSEVTNVAKGAITYTGIIRFRPNKDLLNKSYLKYFLSSELFKSQARNAATGGVIKHFGPIHLKKMKIFLPTLLEQKKIVEKLEAVQNYKKLLFKQKSFLKELFDSVLDKSMKGKLDG